MRLIFTLLLSGLMFSPYAQTLPSSCSATPSMVSLYRNDIEKAATHRLFQINSPYIDSIVIPSVYKDSIAKVFYAIHNMHSSTLKDTIMNLFGFDNFTNFGYETDSIHFHNCGYGTVSSSMYQSGFSSKTIIIYVPDTTSWALQWQLGNYTNTNNAAINALAAQYKITVTNATTILPAVLQLTAKAGIGVNIYALSKAFNTIINSIYPTRPVGYIGDGNSIQLAYEAEGIQITYSNRCGDCPAGCTYGRSWKFKVVYNTCNVAYLGASNFGINANPNTCTRGAVVLPVIFNALEGSLQNGNALLQWKVASQLNIKEYVIEASNNGVQFEPKGVLPANDKSTAAYLWKSDELIQGTIWYRVKAVDKNGNEKYSPVVPLHAAKNQTFTIYPNPVTNHFFIIKFPSPLVGKINVALYDGNGKNVWFEKLELATPISSRTFNLPANLRNGWYALKINNNARTYQQTLLLKGSN